MDDSFSIVELRLIQTSLSKKSEEDIAFLIDKPVEMVSKKIAEIAAALQQQTFLQINAPKQAKLREHQLKKEARQRRLDEEEKRISDKRIRQALLNQQEAERKARKDAEKKPKFTDKVVDYSQLHAVRIDSKTIVYAKPGESSEEVRKRYLKNVRK
jgi:hypothetical protein